MMNFVVSNDIKVYDPDKEIMLWAYKNLVVNNSEFIKKKKLGKWLGNTPEKIYLYEKRNDCLVIPFGCLKDMFGLFLHKYEFKPLFRPIERFLYNSSINLFDYQKKALNEALKAKNGVIVMPCGSGKTQTALQIVAEIGGKCLWLTHTQDLLNQSMNRAKSVFNVSRETFGTITDGKVDIRQITFATVQTMCKLDLAKYRNEFDIIIVDECHKCVGGPTNVMQFYKVLSNLSARYKFGLTATPKRADGLEKSMFALLGNIIIEIPKEAVEKHTCHVKVKCIETGYMPNLDVVLAGDGTINYSSLIEDLIHNEKRFSLVLSTIKEISKNGSVIILGNRVEYLQRLCDSYGEKAVCLSTLGTSKAAKAERKKALLDLNNGDLNCIFATYQLAKEGLDVPNLRYVVFATPEKNEITVEQSAGRVGRKADGKEYGTIIDFVDDFGMYKGWAKRRKSIYKKLNYEMT